MQYKSIYSSPLGEILLAGDEEAITGLWFMDARYAGLGLPPDTPEGRTTAILKAEEWLDVYFSGAEPDFLPRLLPAGSPFRQKVFRLLRQIPRGQTVTYGDLARVLGCASAQAIGGAVGHNPISIMIPCHRVVGADGSLTGYAGGLARKQCLLSLEKADLPSCRAAVLAK